MTYHKSREDIINAFRAIHGDKYDYSCFEYVNYDTKGKVICIAVSKVNLDRTVVRLS